jgi:hypothetical protein
MQLGGFQPFLCSGSSEWLPGTVFSLDQLSGQRMVAQTAEDISLVSYSLSIAVFSLETWN